MSQGEKRAFKIQTKKYGNTDNICLALFDFLSKLPNYNVQKIEKKFVEPRKIKKQFPVIKNQLFYLILNVLNNQTLGTDASLKLFQALGNAELLLNRGLFESALKQLEKAEKVAYTIEDLPLLLKIINKKNDLFRRLLDVERLREKVKESNATKREIKKKLDHAHLVEELYFELFLLYRSQGYAESELLKKQYLELGEKSKELFLFEGMAIRAKHYYYSFQVIYHFAFSSFEKAGEFAVLHLSFLENSPAYLKANINEYLKALNNAIVIKVNLKSFEEAHLLIQKVETLFEEKEAINEFLHQRLFEIKYSNLLSIYVDTENISEGLALVSEIKKGLKKYRNVGMSIDRHVRLCFGLALLYFKKEDWNKSLDWIDEIIKIEVEVLGTPNFVVGYAKLLMCLCHYQIENYFLLDSLIKGTERFLRKHNRLFKIESLLLKTLQKISVRPKERDVLFMNLLKELKVMPSIEKDKGFNTVIEIHKWRMN